MVTAAPNFKQSLTIPYIWKYYEVDKPTCMKIYYTIAATSAFKF